MSKYDINELMGLAYEYCNEEKSSFIGGQTIKYMELNKEKFERVSGFVNWVALKAIPTTPKLATPKRSNHD